MGASDAGSQRLLADKLEALRHNYVQALPEKIRRVTALWDAVSEAPTLEQGPLRALIQVVHKLHGTGYAYGFVELSRTAGSLEAALRDMAAQEQGPCPEDLEAAGELIASLKSTAAQGREGVSNPSASSREVARFDINLSRSR